jgi:hypothetical protein
VVSVSGEVLEQQGRTIRLGTNLPAPGTWLDCGRVRHQSKVPDAVEPRPELQSPWPPSEAGHRIRAWLDAVIAQVLVRTGETAHATPAQLDRTYVIAHTFGK